MKSATLILAVILGLAVTQYSHAGELWFEAGVGHDRKLDEGRNPQSVLRFRYEMENRMWWTPDVLELNHHSSIRDGGPFNHNPEDTTDQFSVIWRFKLR